MKLIIAGSRKIPEGVALLVIADVLAELGWRPREVICGMAASVDYAGKIWAHANGIWVRPFWPRWGELGNAAGPERNCRMARAATHALILWDSKSSGTADMLRQAHDRNLEVKLVEVDSPSFTRERVARPRAARAARATTRAGTRGTAATGG